jgi:hypothetical protein
VKKQPESKNISEMEEEGNEESKRWMKVRKAVQPRSEKVVGVVGV